MDELVFRTYSRMAFREMMALNSEGFSLGLVATDDVRGAIRRFLNGAGFDYVTWRAIPWQDRVLILWHERCVLAWLRFRNEARILDLTLAAPLNRWADQLEQATANIRSDVPTADTAERTVTNPGMTNS